LWVRVGVAVAEVLVRTLLVLDTEDVLVLLGTVVPTVEHAVPRAVASLKVSAKDPLPTPYFRPEEEPYE
jgi:hypothetical protein